MILDTDLARIYGVPTRVLNQAIKRNFDRFPHDFLFRVTQEELERIRSQIVIASDRSQIATASKRNIRHFPYAFTEHGAITKRSSLSGCSTVRLCAMISARGSCGLINRDRFPADGSLNVLV